MGWSSHIQEHHQISCIMSCAMASGDPGCIAVRGVVVVLDEVLRYMRETVYTVMHVVGPSPPLH